MSDGAGSTTALPTLATASVRLRITASTVTAATFCRSSSALCTSTWPGTSAVGSPGRPRPAAVVAAWPRKPSQTRDAVGTPARSATALARHTAGPQHGGRAAPSAGHPRDDRVDPELPELAGQVGEHLLLVATVGRSEGVVAHEADAGEASRDLFLEHGEDLVAPEEIVPELADGL